MRILFMGRKHVAAATLQYLVDRGFTVVAVLTDSHLEGSPTARIARSSGIPLMTLEQLVQAIENESIDFDLGLSIVYWRILPPVVIDAARQGVINFHPAPLPEYKGTAGYNLAILEGLDRWASTAHYIDRGVDTGPIIEIDTFEIDRNLETALSIEAKTMKRMRVQAKRVIEAAVSSGERLATTPNGVGRTISRRQMEAMKFVQPGDDVDRKIRAFWFPPYSGATVSIAGRDYTLVNDEILASLAGEQGTSLYSPSIGATGRPMASDDSEQ